MSPRRSFQGMLRQKERREKRLDARKRARNGVTIAGEKTPLIARMIRRKEKTIIPLPRFRMGFRLRNVRKCLSIGVW